VGIVIGRQIACFIFADSVGTLPSGIIVLPFKMKGIALIQGIIGIIVFLLQDALCIGNKPLKVYPAGYFYRTNTNTYGF